MNSIKKKPPKFLNGKDFEYFTSDIRTVNKHMERCIAVGSTELHTTMHTFHTGMGKHLKIASTKCGRMWSKWNSHILLLKWKVIQRLQTHQLVVSLKVKYLPSHSMSKVFFQENKKFVHTKPYMWMFIAAIFTIAKELETTKMAIDRWMDKYIYNGIPLRSKKEETDTHNLDESQLGWVKEARYKMLQCVWFHLYKMQTDLWWSKADQ